MAYSQVLILVLPTLHKYLMVPRFSLDINYNICPKQAQKKKKNKN